MWKNGQRYRIETPTIATAHDDGVGHQVVITLPRGAIVVIADDPADGSGSLRVRWESRLCEMFTQDLQERGSMVRGEGDRLPF